MVFIFIDIVAMLKFSYSIGIIMKSLFINDNIINIYSILIVIDLIGVN